MVHSAGELDTETTLYSLSVIGMKYVLLPFEFEELGKGGAEVEEAEEKMNEEEDGLGGAICPPQGEEENRVEDD